MLAGAVDRIGLHAERGVEGAPGFLVRHQLDGGHHADAAGGPHQRVVGEAPDALLQQAAHAAHVAEHVALLHQLLAAQRHGDRHRVAGGGEGVGEET